MRKLRAAVPFVCAIDRKCCRCEESTFALRDAVVAPSGEFFEGDNVGYACLRCEAVGSDVNVERAVEHVDRYSAKRTTKAQDLGRPYR